MSAVCQRTKPRIQPPTGFITMRDVLDGKRPVGSMANVIGAVTDFRAPVPTRGPDWKCQIRLYDHSIEDVGKDSVLLNVFRQKREMPDVNLCDVVVIFRAKLQSHDERMSLLTHRSTDIHIYSAGKIPKLPQDASQALLPSFRKTARNPSNSEHEYVSSLHHWIDRGKLPTEAEFEVVKQQSTKVADKFRELRSVRDNMFADVVVQIVKQPYDAVDKSTIWVSDYTENEMFFHFALNGIHVLEAQAGNGVESRNEWTGPFGKQSMQVTCYEPHASFIRDRRLPVGSWIMLRNLQIKYGHNAANLEGFLREDRAAPGVRINIASMDPRDTDASDPRLKEAIRRKRAYEREKKEQLRGISEAAKAGKKRKIELADIAPPLNSKSRRNANRAAKQAEHKMKQIAVPDLNSQVKCENQTKGTSTIEAILEPIYTETPIAGQEVKLRLPFTNMNYRANVRVVNFMPSELENFSSPRKASEYDMLSDDAGSDSGSDSEQDITTAFNLEREWEWRFLLELEDATPVDGGTGRTKVTKTVWVTVDNLAAQCLMNLDASDLRRNHNDLEALRQRLFLLWGELEEHKSREAAESERTALASKPVRPPLHSSDDEGKAQKQQQEQRKFNNRPFACCIRQYGVKVPESDPCKADAGNGMKWQRMFGLFGTKITTA